MHLFKIVHGNDWRKYNRVFVEATNKKTARDRALKVYGLIQGPFFVTQVPDQSIELFKKIFTVI